MIRDGDKVTLKDGRRVTVIDTMATQLFVEEEPGCCYFVFRDEVKKKRPSRTPKKTS
jgi:hypothetical protein